MTAARDRRAGESRRDRDERVTMARGLAFLFGAGGTLVFITLALPHSANTNDAAVAIPPALAYVVVAVLLLAGGRLPRGAFELILAVGAVLVSLCVGYGGDSAHAYALMYVWVTLYAGYFFEVRWIVFFVAFCGILFADAEALRGHAVVPEVFWLMSIGTATVGAALIGSMTHRLRGQASDLAAVVEVANGLIDVSDLTERTCEALREATGAGAVCLFEVDDGRELHLTAAAGEDRQRAFLVSPAPAADIGACLESGRTRTLAPPSGGERWRADCAGHAQPILRDGSPVGVLAIAFARPRRSVSARVRSAAELFAAEASVALERRARLTREHERRAMEINDNIVQGLVVARYALEAGQVDRATQAVDDTLGRAREIMTRQLAEITGGERELRPGDLVRRESGSPTGS